MSQNISTNGIKITMIAIPLMPTPLEIDNLSADADPWDVTDIETGGAQTTPDGQSVFFGKNARTEATLTLSGASKAGKILSDFLQRQSRIGVVPPVICNYTFTITNQATGEVETFFDGQLISGTAGQGFGSEKKKDKTFTFSFSQRG